MQFLVVVGAFGISAGVLMWAKLTNLLSDATVSGFAVLLILAGLIFPFYSIHQSKRRETTPTGGKDAETSDALGEALGALATAIKAQESKKKAQ